MKTSKEKTEIIKNTLRTTNKACAIYPQCGMQIVVYNFMPILDWIRTDISYPMPDKSLALRFERLAFIAFDLVYAETTRSRKRLYRKRKRESGDFFRIHDRRRKRIIIPECSAGFTRKQRTIYRRTNSGVIENLRRDRFENIEATSDYFLQEIVPVAEESGINLAIHPDDPPYPVLGLPRIVSTEKDIAELIESRSFTS